MHSSLPIKLTKAAILGIIESSETRKVLMSLSAGNQYSQIIERIQTDLQGYVGAKMKLKANLGRSKIIETEGVLEEAHPKLFILTIDDGDNLKRISYSYADLLTQTVELSGIETSENLLPWLSS